MRPYRARRGRRLALTLMAGIIVCAPAAGQTGDTPEAGAVLRFMEDCISKGTEKQECETRFFESCADRGHGTTQASIQCSDALSRYWDRELNRVYQELMKEADQPLREAIRQSQRAWLAWRDARCQPWGQMQGTMYLVLGAACHTETIQRRVDDLGELLDAIGN